MRKIDRVIYQEIVPPALISLVLLTFVVFTREFGRLAETLIRKEADGFTVLQVVLYLLPSILIFTVPVAFLIGTLIGFSRLSAESEIVAMRASGVGLLQILSPVLKASVVVLLIGLALNLYLLPAGNWNLRLVRRELGFRPVQSQLKPRVFNEDLPGTLLYVEDIDVASGLWKGVFLADSKQDGERRIITATEGRMAFSPDSKRVQVSLFGGSSYEFNPGDSTEYGVSAFHTLEVGMDLPESALPDPEAKRYSDKEMAALISEFRYGDDEQRSGSWIEINRRFALACSALIFALLGVGFGVTPHRAGRGYGTVVGVCFAFTYYILFASGSRMASQGSLSVWTGVWGANFFLGLIGVMALRRARLGLGFLDAWPSLGKLYRIPYDLLSVGARIRKAWEASVEQVRGHLGAVTGLRVRGTLILDTYIAKSFLGYWLIILTLFLALFYLFTFFELIDDLIVNRGTMGLMLEYFGFLLPQVFLLLVPISLLVGTMVSLGLLEKTLQLTAIKASGISVYRVAMPLLAISLVVSGLTFLVQEQVLPYANQRQDNLRNVIKGRPVQTSYHPDRNWIFGEGDRIFNYSFFDSEKGVFGDLSVFETDLNSQRVLSHTYAKRAQWDRSAQQWQLEQGWVRDLAKEHSAFQAFEQRMVAFPEKPDYFTQEVLESSKMTYSELQTYIRELQHAGFEVDYLLTEFYKKLSFPIVSLIMVILGIPFALSVGKRGALHGVAAGVLLGIVYWGAYGVFGVLGSNGMLAPWLAAWAPNLLFGSGGLVLLLSIRT